MGTLNRRPTTIKSASTTKLLQLSPFSFKTTPAPMDPSPATISAVFFRLFLLLSLLLLARAAPFDLYASDRGAFLAFQTALGITNVDGQLLSHEVCHIAGVDCERRLSDAVPVVRITRLVYESMRLTGSLSPSIGKLTELRELSIQNNHLTDQLPPEIVNCRKLEILNLKNNQFSGVITPDLSSLIRLRVLDLSSNKFSGSLAFLKYFPNLEKLSLADNQFSGKVPASIRSFRHLQFFNFSGNHFLQGQIPLMDEVKYSSPELPKRYILTENSTTGRRNGTTASANAVAPSSKEAEAPSPASPPPKKHKISKKKKVILWVLGFIAGIITGSICGFVFSVLFKLLLLWIKGGKKKPGPEVYSKQIKAEDLAFLENEDGLTSLEMIGKGACGEVYKAQLAGSDSKWIAIKKITQLQNDPGELNEEDSKMLNKKMRQIRSEIETVGNIRHRNLLPLLAHVAKPECHYLVYEYMKNGSLQDALNNVSRGLKDLDWLLRFQIALGIAAGLEHLHMGNAPRIIHRDLKPANILLDDDMEARIADFGLAKAIPDTNTHMTATNVAGTVGYIAPEYYQTFKFTEKCDIFSFGVILGALVMGKQPSDEFFQHTNEMNMVKWLRNVMTSENPNQAIDSNLQGNGYEEQMLLVLKIACFCTLDDPKQRPNSKNVRCMLSQIEH